jgi:hypothetical protein
MTAGHNKHAGQKTRRATHTVTGPLVKVLKTLQGARK